MALMHLDSADTKMYCRWFFSSSFCLSVWLQDMVCTREAPLAERALEVLEVFLCSQRDYEADLCTNLRPALLQALQGFSVENMGHGFGHKHTAQGKKQTDAQEQSI